MTTTKSSQFQGSLRYVCLPITKPRATIFATHSARNKAEKVLVVEAVFVIERMLTKQGGGRERFWERREIGGDVAEEGSVASVVHNGGTAALREKGTEIDLSEYQI